MIRKLSIQRKIILWFSTMLLIIVLLITSMTFAIAASVLNENIKERLLNVVSSNVLEIEYINNLSQSEREPGDQFLQYGGGWLEIDDDFFDVHEGISTALYDSEGNLLYGDSPIKLTKSETPVYTKIEKINYKGDGYYVYDSTLTAKGMEGLWLRGTVSQNENINILYNVVRLSFWLLPALALLAVFGGYIITRRSFLPIEQIAKEAEEIGMGADLSKRLDIGEGDDEIHMLANTFNDMFDRLEKNFNAEKQFTSNASHELRTPTAVILAQSQYALELADSTEEYKESFKVIEHQAKRMSEIISQLLFFTRLEQGTETVCKESICMSKLIEEICCDVSSYSQKNIKLQYSTEPDVFCCTDYKLLTYALTNLIGNAFKYGKENGHIWISLHKKDDNVYISIKDDGIGISNENIEKIWTRFYQEDSSRSNSSSDAGKSGIGLGLSMVKEICTLLDIEITVSSVHDIGSEFTLKLQ